MLTYNDIWGMLMISQINNSFVLNTKNTTYAFGLLETGQLEHYYYGKRIHFSRATLMEKHEFSPGNTNQYDKEHLKYSLEDMRLEMSTYGKGDIREPMLEIVHEDGSFTSDFIYKESKQAEGKAEFDTLPGSYGTDDEVETLTIIMKDEQYGLTLYMNYYVYENADVITRSVRLVNDSRADVEIRRILSMCIDFDTPDFVFTTFSGEWAREMKRIDTRMLAGKHVNASYTGSSSSRANPFVMLSKQDTNEDSGVCYGFNLIYSGNHYEAVEVNGFGKTRFVSGINPQSFSFLLKPGEAFESPEAVMTFSDKGFNGMSQNMHGFVREHIVRGEWKDKVRPVLLNSWEAAYFNINEKKLLKLARAAKEVGIELFVMDDGWFGTRNDDTQSLGDWEVNKKKLPHGVDGLCKKINNLGLDFGIWVEPEMVNVNSKLYETHPEWVLQIPDRPHSEGRNQRILDLGRAEVQDYIIEAMSRVFGCANISYVKWDMNRTFSDYYSCVPKATYSDESKPSDAGAARQIYIEKNSHAVFRLTNQGETAHRYMMGLYRVMKILTEKFPHILFEGCAAGGNRFDLGVLCYFPQIWASDNTDALCRASIQTGYSYGYPLSTVSAHVSSCPNHQTLRITPLETRFNIACFGICGYECNLVDMGKEDLEAIKAQIELYKKWREVLQKGSFYRGRTFFAGDGKHAGDVLESGQTNITEWTCVSADKSKAVGMVMQKLVAPNTQYTYYKPSGLDPDKEYHFYNRKLKYNIKNFGDLINTAAPFHVKQDSFVHDVVAKFVKMDGEIEDFKAYGDTMMYGGVKLKQAFGGTGYSGEVRYFQDFSSRLYFMEET